MKLLLGPVYLAGGGDSQASWHSLTLSFWNEESRGEPFRYARLLLHANDTTDMVASQLRMLAEKLEKEVLPYEEAK